MPHLSGSHLSGLPSRPGQAAVPAAGRSDAGTRPPEQHGILLIEDDDDVGGEIIADLQGRGYRLTRAETGPDGLQAARDRSISLVIADRMLPGLDGLTLIATLRAEGIQVPVLVLSALGSVDDRIRGLRAGGDDYLTKPFAMEELAARVDALLRRPVETRESVLRIGPLVMDLIDRTVHRGDRTLDTMGRSSARSTLRRSLPICTSARLVCNTK